MTSRERVLFARLAVICREHLSTPARRSMDIWRSDMRAILGAAKELDRLTDRVRLLKQPKGKVERHEVPCPGDT